MKQKNKIEVISLGCSKNTVDSERIMRQLRLNDFEITDNSDKADTIIINTCGFIEAAKEESINTILEAVELKKQGKIKKVIVAGCLSQRYKDELRLEIPEVDNFFGTEDYGNIIGEVGGNLKKELLGERELSTPKHYAYLKISEGCDNPCSFCAIPIMRGKHKSIPEENLISEGLYLAKQGVKELIVIGQDTTDYGKELYGKRTISRLLNKLSGIDGIEWIKLLYAYPSHFPKDLIETIALNPKICKYIDIPLQHISDKILKSMRRGISKRRTRELLYELREKIPDLTIRTTFISGYPGETEKEFQELCEFIKEIKFDRMGVFTYSMEENTSSFDLGDPVPDALKEERKTVLMEIQKDISLDNNSKLLGRKMKILLDSMDKDYYIGRTERDAPEVDGEILIPVSGVNLSVGNFYSVEIYDFNEYDLFGKIIQKDGIH